MSILALLVAEIWWFYIFWGVSGPVCHFLDTQYMFFKNYYILWIHMTKCSKKGQTLDVVSRVILSQIFFNMLNWQKNVMNSQTQFIQDFSGQIFYIMATLVFEELERFWKYAYIAEVFSFKVFKTACSFKSYYLPSHNQVIGNYPEILLTEYQS